MLQFRMKPLVRSHTALRRLKRYKLDCSLQRRSRLLFAWTVEDMKSRNWLGAYRRMFTYYGGAPHVIVPDCLKQGGNSDRHFDLEGEGLRARVFNPAKDRDAGRS